MIVSSQAEHDFLKETLPFARAHLAACARSSDPRVIVGLSDGSASASDRNPDGRNDGTGVHLKVKCGAAPETAQFYVTVYGDRYMRQLLATWRVFVHSLRRHDIGEEFRARKEGGTNLFYGHYKSSKRVRFASDVAA